MKEKRESTVLTVSCKVVTHVFIIMILLVSVCASNATQYAISTANKIDVASKQELVEKFIKVSGLNDQLSLKSSPLPERISMLKYQKVMCQQENNIDCVAEIMQQVNILNILSQAFIASSKTFDSSIKENSNLELSKKEIKFILRWLESPLGGRINRAENLFQANGVAQIVSVDSKRQQLLNTILADTGQIEASIKIEFTVALNTAELEQRKGDINQLYQRIVDSVTEDKQNQSSSLYKDFSDAQLLQYINFLQSQPMRKVMKMQDISLDETISNFRAKVKELAGQKGIIL